MKILLINPPAIKFGYYLTDVNKENLGIIWTCKSRIDNISSTIIKNMSEAGCYLIAFGAESTAPSVLNAVNKGITLEQIANAIKLCKKHLYGILNIEIKWQKRKIEHLFDWISITSTIGLVDIYIKKRS